MIRVSETAYEIVLGEKLDKRNFRRKILAAGVIEASGAYRTGEGRPAQLYRYWRMRWPRSKQDGCFLERGVDELAMPGAD